MVKLKSGYLEGTIGMLHGEAQAELRTEFNMTLQRPKMIMSDSGFELGKAVAAVWWAILKPVLLFFSCF